MRHRLVTKAQRLAARYFPEGARRHTEAGYEFGQYEINGRIGLIAYRGTAARPCVHGYCQTDEARQRVIAQYVKAGTEAAERKSTRKAEKRKPHSLQVGHILKASWGYDQTNVDWYKVVRVISPHMVEIAKIGSIATPGASDGGVSSMAGYCLPNIDGPEGETSRHRVSADNYVRLSSFHGASLWSGKPAFESWYG
ncbi:MAG: hypothetical protein AB7J28_15870 [Hyphomonadaceae bacterium]